MVQFEMMAFMMLAWRLILEIGATNVIKQHFQIRLNQICSNSQTVSFPQLALKIQDFFQGGGCNSFGLWSSSLSTPLNKILNFSGRLRCNCCSKQLGPVRLFSKVVLLRSVRSLRCRLQKTCASLVMGPGLMAEG